MANRDIVAIGAGLRPCVSWPKGFIRIFQLRSLVGPRENPPGDAAFDCDLLRLPGAIGVLLTGTLGDSAPGLSAIEQRGGIGWCKIQRTQHFRNAKRRDNPNHVVDLRESPALPENCFVSRPAIRSQCRIRCDTDPRLREMAGQA